MFNQCILEIEREKSQAEIQEQICRQYNSQGYTVSQIKEDEPVHIPIAIGNLYREAITQARLELVQKEGKAQKFFGKKEAV